MPTVRGKSDVKRFIASVPEQLREKVLRGAARAAANVVAAEAQERSISPAVSAHIKVATKREEDQIIARVQVRMGGYNLPLWLEYGTHPHFISVDNSQRGGLSVRRTNQRLGEADGDASLVIGGEFVGKTVLHPGARPHPFLRPALDAKQGEAIAAAQTYINARVKRTGITGSDPGDTA